MSNSAADTRKLVHLETISSIKPANHAERLEIVQVLNWDIVVPKGVYSVGQPVLFFEIDSLIPVSEKRFYIPPQNTIKIAGEVFYRVQTTKVRGNLSQGFIAPIHNFTDINLEQGIDYSDLIGVKKYNPVPPINSKTIGDFPLNFAIKSDSERIQNLTETWDSIKSEHWYATEKIDGTSITIFNDGSPHLRVASRNHEVDPHNHPVFNVIDHKELKQAIPIGGAITGELYGEKIQGNPLNLWGQHYSIFSVFNRGKIVPRNLWDDLFLNHEAPHLVGRFDTLPQTIGELIEKVNGLQSVLNPNEYAEGIVFHHIHGKIPQGSGLERPNFKVINNQYLLDHKNK